jgi:hypothetical protein
VRQRNHCNRCANAIAAIAAPTPPLQSLHQCHRRRNRCANATPAATNVTHAERSTIIIDKRTHLPSFFLRSSNRHDHKKKILLPNSLQTLVRTWHMTVSLK